MTTTWKSVAPIDSRWGTTVVFSQPFVLGHGVSLAHLPDWLRSHSVLDQLSWGDREEIQNASRYALIVDYQAEAAGTLDPDWAGSQQRSLQDSALEKLQVASLAIWLARPSSIGFSFTIDVSGADGEWTGRGTKRFSWLKPLASYSDARVGLSELATARRVFYALLSHDRKGPLWRGVRTLWAALLQDVPETRYVQIWTSLESLFGPSSASEVTFRIAQRIALFLYANPEAARGVFRQAKKAYSLRSKVVHGRSLTKLKPPEADELTVASEEFLRQAIVKIFDDPQLTAVFSGSELDEYLDELPFAHQEDPG